MNDTVRASSAGRPYVWRTALFVLVVSSSIWLGGISMRAIIGSDLLRLGTLTFEPYLPPDAEREIFRLLSLTSLVTIAGYLTALVSSIVFLWQSPLTLRDHGWLMMSAILFYLFVPVEFYTLYLDAQMIYLEFFTTADNQVFRELFIARVAALAGAPIIAALAYYTIIALAIFQPFRKRRTPAA